MSITIDFGGGEAFQQTLAKFGESVEHALRPAAQAGAQVYYDALVAEYGKLVKDETLNLRKSLYQAYRKEKANKNAQFYAVSWAGSSAKSGKSSQHAHLIEFGFIRRYQAVKNKQGKFITAVRQEKQGTPKPKRRASQSEKDAYYVLRKGGPVQVAARPFLRNTINSNTNFANAQKAMADRLFAELAALTGAI